MKILFLHLSDLHFRNSADINKTAVDEIKPFADYPDIVNIDQLREMLGGVGYKAAYRLLHDGSIRCFKIGKAFRIPKASVIEYLHEKPKI